MAKGTFREQMLKAREDALLATVSRLLCEKGYEAMTIDTVADEVGIAKASLYKHFASKEELAAAGMTQVLDRALDVCERLHEDPALDAREKLRAVARWGLEEQLAGRMPSLPGQNSALRSALIAHGPYIDRLVRLSERMGTWIADAQKRRLIDPKVPPIVVLYTVFARGCDPVLVQLKAGGEFGDEEIIEWVLRTCFAGLDGPAAVTPTSARARSRRT